MLPVPEYETSPTGKVNDFLNQVGVQSPINLPKKKKGKQLVIQEEYKELLVQGSYLGTSKGLNFLLGIDIIYMKSSDQVGKKKKLCQEFFFLNRNL